VRLSLHPASKAHILNKDIFYSFGRFYWKRKWLDFFSSKEAIGFCNGRTALYFLLKNTQFKDKKEVIISAYTCPTVSKTIQIAGYQVVYCDIDFDSGTMSTTVLKTLINCNTHSVITANTYGAIDNVIEIKRMLDDKDIYLFEDITWGIGSVFGIKPVGSYGDASFVSLGLGKNLTVGGGGILLINSEKIQQDVKENGYIFQTQPFNFLSFIKLFFYNGITNKYIYKILHLFSLTPKDTVASVDIESVLLCQSLDSYRKRLSSNTLTSFLQLDLKVNFYVFNEIMKKKSTYIHHISKSTYSSNYSSRRPILLNEDIKPSEFIEHMNSEGYQITRGFYQNKSNLNYAEHKNAIKYCDRLVTIPSNYSMTEVELNNMVKLM